MALLARLPAEERDRVLRTVEGPSPAQPSVSAPRFVPLPTGAGSSSVVVRTCESVANLDGKGHDTSLDSDRGSLIVEAIRETGIGPGYGVETHKEEDGGYTEDTDTEYCVHVTLSPDQEPPVVNPGTAGLPSPGPDMLAFYLSRATFSEGARR
ncbi:hypothetical protein [Streptomyces sp. NPDC058855]|uniref:hypothetical protein n=1 Tax=Streptomyces sp. NPDC058855 TaxID=3346651 RepID=UPI00369A07ED